MGLTEKEQNKGNYGKCMLAYLIFVLVGIIFFWQHVFLFIVIGGIAHLRMSFRTRKLMKVAQNEIQDL